MSPRTPGGSPEPLRTRQQWPRGSSVEARPQTPSRHLGTASPPPPWRPSTRTVLRGKGFPGAVRPKERGGPSSRGGMRAQVPQAWLPGPGVSWDFRGLTHHLMHGGGLLCLGGWWVGTAARQAHLAPAPLCPVLGVAPLGLTVLISAMEQASEGNWLRVPETWEPRRVKGAFISHLQHGGSRPGVLRGHKAADRG